MELFRLELELQLGTSHKENMLLKPWKKGKIKSYFLLSVIHSNKKFDKQSDYLMVKLAFQYVPAIPLCIASGKKSDVKGAHPRTVMVPPGTEKELKI